MRFTRIMTMLVAVFTAALMGLTTSSTAEAATKTAPVATQAAASSAVLPPHVIEYLSRGKVPGTRATFYAKGRAVTNKGGRVYLQVRTAANPTYRTVKYTTATTDTGRFVFKFTGPCGAGYQLVIRATASHARTAFRLGKIVCS